MSDHQIVPIDVIARRITVLRRQRVILDEELALLYGISTKRLNEQVRRNLDRFPEDFMFQVTKTEDQVLRSQFATSKNSRGGRRYLPYVFTESGALQAASVVNSPRAIQVGIYVHRAFVQLRDLLATHKNLARELNNLEKRVAGHDKDIQAIVEAIRKLLHSAEPSKPRIGFRAPGESD